MEHGRRCGYSGWLFGFVVKGGFIMSYRFALCFWEKVFLFFFGVTELSWDMIEYLDFLFFSSFL